MCFFICDIISNFVHYARYVRYGGAGYAVICYIIVLAMLRYWLRAVVAPRWCRSVRRVFSVRAAWHGCAGCIYIYVLPARYERAMLPACLLFVLMC